LIGEAAERLAAQPALDHSLIRATHAAVEIDAQDGVTGELIGEKAPIRVSEGFPIPDLLSHLAAVLPVSRSTIGQVMIQSGRLGEASINPQQFIDQVQDSVRGALAEQMVDGIKYERRTDGAEASYDLSLFAQRELTGYEENILSVQKSIYTDVVFDSDLERRIALALDAREDIALFMKLPGWFEVDTPVGAYNPDWAVVKTAEDGTETLYLVRESKASRELESLRPEERLKIRFGEKHFDAVGVGFDVIDDPAQI
jgi:type III restriction enzyme